MTEEELSEHILKARIQLPLPSDHPHDLIWIPVGTKMEKPKGFKDIFFVVPSFLLRHHKVYFKKNFVAGIAIGWEFYQFVEYKE